jgi:hypothetical protein
MLRHFCYFIAIVVSCYLIAACCILIVVSGYRICCLVMVSYGGVAYCIGYCIGCLGMAGVGFPYPCLVWRRAKTLFGLGLTLLDFVFFCAMVDGCGEGRKACSDLSLLCFIFVI